VSARDLLRRHREAVRDRWLELIRSTYPEDTARFLRTERDPFANPVGAALERGTAGVLEAIVAGEPEALEGSLDALLRIRSVQDLSPAEAVRAVALLETAAWDVFGEELERLGVAAARDLHRVLDGVLLVAFEVYARCRERLHEVRLREALRRRAVELRRAARARSREETVAAGGGRGGEVGKGGGFR